MFRALPFVYEFSDTLECIPWKVLDGTILAILIQFLWHTYLIIWDQKDRNEGKISYTCFDFENQSAGYSILIFWRSQTDPNVGFFPSKANNQTSHLSMPKVKWNISRLYISCAISLANFKLQVSDTWIFKTKFGNKCTNMVINVSNFFINCTSILDFIMKNIFLWC